MGYWQEDGRWADIREVSLASGTKTESGVGDAVEVGDRGTLRLALQVDGADDTFTLDVDVETSSDGESWGELGSFTQATSEGSERKTFAGADRFVRASWALAGDATEVTFSVVGEAV